MRTIEVLPTRNEPQNWKLVFSGESNALYFDKKNTAVRRGRLEAKQTSNEYGYSVGLKIFGKDGEYQRQHVYEP
jgi:hypothetical protein